MPSLGATILVVGDVHGHWRTEDAAFLESGRHDLALFVGDLGDEDVELVRKIADIDAPKAVILGNHDAWQSFSKKQPTQKLRDSLDALGDDHLAYGVREVPRAGLSVIGARPFSWGGRSLRSAEVYGELFGVRSAEESAQRIVDAARRAQHRDLLILAHNGPTGLSRHPADIWGKDFGKSPGGDWGDRDLQMAVERIRDLGLRIQAVIAGHMHHRLMRARGRQRSRFVCKDGVLYANAAVVPRVRGDDGTQLAHYLSTTWSEGALRSIEEIWVDGAGVIRERTAPRVVEL
jgi:uncharacterized protein (TIGR04168 family)